MGAKIVWWLLITSVQCSRVYNYLFEYIIVNRIVVLHTNRNIFHFQH